ncbi:MAG TPA: hypothetical protein VFF58_00615 [Candidatus Nitrosotalea sp.]|nr:hypothetical protein [Candidatus Nitrosotalea sp.]
MRNRFILAVFAVFLALSLVPDGRSTAQVSGTYEETLYPSHTCPGGHNWYVESADSDSVTVACYTPDDSEGD